MPEAGPDSSPSPAADHPMPWAARSRTGQLDESLRQSRAIDAQIEPISGYIDQRNRDRSLTVAPVSPKKFTVQDLIPFLTEPRGAFIPADATVIAEKIIPGYRESSVEEIAALKQRADENYGEIPGEAAAFVLGVGRAIQPLNAFVFGTGRGRIEELILEASPQTEITTIDLPDELLATARAAPDGNNLRYRQKLGVNNDTIGDRIRDSQQVHQLLGDSMQLDPGKLKDQMQLIVVDGSHLLPSVLHDAGNALLLADTTNGAVILFDDCRKTSPLNGGVESALGIVSQLTGYPVVMPTPKPNADGLKADMGMIVVPPGTGRTILNEVANYLKAMGLQLQSVQPL